MNNIAIQISLEKTLDLMGLNSSSLGGILKPAYQVDGIEEQLTAAIRSARRRQSEAMRNITSDELDMFGERVGESAARMVRYCDDLISALRRIARAAGVGLDIPELES